MTNEDGLVVAISEFVEQGQCIAFDEEGDGYPMSLAEFADVLEDYVYVIMHPEDAYNVRAAAGEGWTDLQKKLN